MPTLQSFLTDDGWRILRRFLLPYLLVSAALMLGYSVLRWWLDLELHLLPFMEHVWDLYLAILAGAVALGLLLSRRAKDLNASPIYGKQRAMVVFVLGVFLVIPTMVLQPFLKRAVQSLIPLDSPADIDLNASKRYYSFQHFEIDTSRVAHPAINQREVKIKNEYWQSVYLAMPLKHPDTAALYLPRIWLCLAERQTLPFSATPEVRQRSADSLLARTYDRFMTLKIGNVSYFENLPANDERDHIMDAISGKGALHRADEFVLLAPRYEPFDPALASRFGWVLLAFLGCNAFIFWVLLADQTQKAPR